MLYLTVPYAQKDQAKALGARWGTNKRCWYVPDGVPADAFAQWAASPQAGGVPTIAATAPLLFIDLVPSTAWFSNLRSELTTAEWDLVRRQTYQAAGHHCSACQGQGPRHPVECHERWNYDLSTRVQSLLGTVALCPACHETTHYGLAEVRGRGRGTAAKANLMRVNNWSGSMANQHIRQAMATWVLRSSVQWQLDARLLLDYVPLSDTTRQKILGHAAGSLDQSVRAPQQTRLRYR